MRPFQQSIRCCWSAAFACNTQSSGQFSLHQFLTPHPGGYVKGLRIGQLPSSQNVASVGDVRLICTNVSGGADVIIGQGSGDIAGLDYVDATLNGSSGSNQGAAWGVRCHIRLCRCHCSRG